MDKLEELYHEMSQRITALATELEDRLKAIRDDELRKTIEGMAADVGRRLTAIEARLTAIEGEEV